MERENDTAGSGRRVTAGEIELDGITFGYNIHGAGPDTVVLLPALLMSRAMQEPLARSLAPRHIRVICLDYLGTRVDGAPQDPAHFSSDVLGAQVVSALDRLGVERTVIGGTSIGANIALEPNCRRRGCVGSARSPNCASGPSGSPERSRGSSVTAAVMPRLDGRSPLTRSHTPITGGPHDRCRRADRNHRRRLRRAGDGDPLQAGGNRRLRRAGARRRPRRDLAR